MHQAIQIALPAAIGAAVALITNTFTSWLTHWRERKTWQNALRGEINAIVSVVTSRELIGLVETKIKETEVSGQVHFPQFSVRGEYFTVFHSSAERGKLGMLGSGLASDIARFYVVATSVVEDLNYMADAKPGSVPKNQALSEMAHLRDALKEMIGVGDTITR